MKLSFKIHYRTAWGEKLYVTGSPSFLGNWDPNAAIEMANLSADLWQAEIESDESCFEYKYLFCDANGNFFPEWGKPRKIDLKKITLNEIQFSDLWRPNSNPDNIYLSSAFTNCLMRRVSRTPERQNKAFSKLLRFQINMSVIQPEYKLAILGNDELIGNWDEKRAVVMSDKNFPLWSVDIEVSEVKFPLNYKYVIYDDLNKKVIHWEEGNNRIISDFISSTNKSVHIFTDEKFRHPSGSWHGAGVAIPLFSLRTEHSGGVGEFHDIIPLVDWAKQTGLKLIQLLPLNETVSTHSWVDSYPYKSISVMALHPVYLNITKIGVLDDDSLMIGFMKTLAGYNALESVHYEEVHKTKSKFFKLIFDQQMVSFLATPSFKDFFKHNKEWLVPYSAFCYLRDQYKTADFSYWKENATYDSAEIAKLTSPKSPHYPDIAVHYFIQYHAHKQLKEAVDYARSNGVILKGDIPIGISPNSVEAWTQPELFNLNQQAGAPPDDFADQGQNWGFPTYNWSVMAKDHFSWWRKRLQQMSLYFDAVRIDHIVGFFRIWEIPISQVWGTMGHFNPALPFSRDEIIDRGIQFNEERYTKPYIRDYFLWELFGEYTDEVKNTYLSEYEPGKFNLHQKISTQRQVWKYFEANKTGEELNGRETRIRDGLCSLISEVLFVRDPERPTHFHPRIGFHDTNSYLNLSDYNRYLLDELYIEFFYQRHEVFWKEEAFKKLPGILHDTEMMICGEDLGMIPGCVPEVMNEMGILSLEVQRMPKDPKVEFLHPSDAPYLSVCTTSTHDTSTLRGWWKEDTKKSERFYRILLGQKGLFHSEMDPWLAKDILHQHFWSPAMLAIFPIQDLLAIDQDLRKDDFEGERINVPAVAQHYWRYRLHLTLEKLSKAKKFNSDLAGIINQSGR